MPSASDFVEVPSDAATVAQRYHRLERPVGGLVALLVAGVVGAAVLFLPLATGLLVALVAVALFRVPVFQSDGTVRLVADAEPAAVKADFERPTPPPLALQWGVADSVRPTADGAHYEFSSLFGLQTAAMELERRSTATDDGESTADLELAVTENGSPWATYSVTVRDQKAETVVDVAWTSERRFGLRRLPQWFVAERYRTEALAAQGYRTVDRDASLSV
jgi:hypothetical protein